MKNIHLDHLEDRIFIDGEFLGVIKKLSSLIDFLEGKDGVILSIKMDGSPSFVFGRHPETGKFFVSTKSAFSGKVAYSENEIENVTKDEGLREKLAYIFSSFCGLEWGKVIQGDLLWWPGMYEEDPYEFRFRPNTLTYSLPKRGKRVKKIGVALHTEYYGTSMEDLMGDMYTHDGRKVPDAEIFCSKITKIDPVEDWDISLLRSKLESIKSLPILQKTSDNTYRSLCGGRAHNILMKFLNHCVRYNISLTQREFKIFIFTEYFRENARLKTMRGKQRKNEEAKRLVDSLDDSILEETFQAYSLIRELKNEIITHLNARIHEDPFVVMLPSGSITSHEGYVVKFTDDGDFVKLVKRHVFSRENMIEKKVWKP